MPLLDRSRHGIEFFGLADQAKPAGMQSSKAHGLQRFAAFCALLAELARCTDYRLLSNVQMQGEDDNVGHDQINAIVDRITGDIASPLSAQSTGGRARHEREPVRALLPPHDGQHLHRLRQPRARSTAPASC